MILDSSENKCIIQILSILHKGNSNYSSLFRLTKFSHITLQNALKVLLEKKFIKKEDFYAITEKGKELLHKLEDLLNLIKQ